MQEVLTRARDDAEPDWQAIGAPSQRWSTASTSAIQATEGAARGTGADAGQDRKRHPHLRRASVGLLRQKRFHPDLCRLQPDRRSRRAGRELSMALNGLDARSYKNSTLLFNLARVFIARSPVRGVINPPWIGIAEPLWEPVQIRHRSAYYDAFFTEALLSFHRERARLARRRRRGIARAIADMVDFCLTTSAEEVRSA